MMRAEDVFGPPMAAPETKAMRGLRKVFIVVAMITGVATLAIELLVIGLGRAGTGGLLLILVTLTAGSGLVFFRVKTRRDDRWILSRGFERDRDVQ